MRIRANEKRWISNRHRWNWCTILFIINRFQCYIRIPCKILVWILLSIIIKKYFKMCLWVLKYCNVSLDNTTKRYSSGLGVLESYRALVHKKIIRCAPLFFMTPARCGKKQKIRTRDRRVVRNI